MKEVMQYIELIPEFKPVISEVFKNLAMYEEEWEQFTSFFVKNTVKNKVAIYKGFIDEGISEEHALALTINSTTELQKGVQQYQSKVKSTKGAN